MEAAFLVSADQTCEPVHPEGAEACQVLVAAVQAADHLASQALAVHQVVVDPSSSEAEASSVASVHTEAEERTPQVGAYPA